MGKGKCFEVGGEKIEKKSFQAKIVDLTSKFWVIYAYLVNCTINILEAIVIEGNNTQPTSEYQEWLLFIFDASAINHAPS